MPNKARQVLAIVDVVKSMERVSDEKQSQLIQLDLFVTSTPFISDGSLVWIALFTNTFDRNYWYSALTMLKPLQE